MEFAEWMAMHQIEPIGSVRGDVQAAIVAAAVANHAGWGRRGEPAKATDFLPDFSIDPATAIPKEEVEAAQRKLEAVRQAKAKAPRQRKK